MTALPETGGGEIESPCTQICIIDPERRLCKGCARTIDEITNWTKFTPAQREDIMRALPHRPR